MSAWSDVFWFSFWYVGAWWVVLWLPFWYMWLFFLLLNEKMAFAFVYLVQFPVSRKLQLIDLHIKLSKLWDTFGTRDCDQFVSWRGSLQCKPQHELPDFLVLWPNVRNVRTYCATVRAHEVIHAWRLVSDILQNWRLVSNRQTSELTSYHSVQMHRCSVSLSKCQVEVPTVPIKYKL